MALNGNAMQSGKKKYDDVVLSKCAQHDYSGTAAAKLQNRGNLNSEQSGIVLVLILENDWNHEM